MVRSELKVHSVNMYNCFLKQMYYMWVVPKNNK